MGDLQKGLAHSMDEDADAVALGVGSQALFVADDGVTGPELWTTSGNAKTTKVLVDAVPGGEGLRPRELTRAGTLVFFAGDDGVSGYELYVLDQRPLGASLAIKFGKQCKLKGKRPPAIGLRGVPELGTIELGFVAKTSKKRAPVALFFGASRIAANVGPCQFSVVTLFTLVGATDDAGKADIPIVVPNDVKLVGTTLQTQFAVVSPGGSIAGIFDLTDALEIVVGKRSD